MMRQNQVTKQKECIAYHGYRRNESQAKKYVLVDGTSIISSAFDSI